MGRSLESPRKRPGDLSLVIVLIVGGYKKTQSIMDSTIPFWGVLDPKG